MRNRIKNSILYLAIRKRHIRFLKYLINIGFDLNWEQKDSKYIRPIEYACLYGNAEAVNLLVESGCELNFPDSIICQELTARKRKHTLRYLLNKGMTPDICTMYKGTGLHWAAQDGDVEIAELLIRHGADVNMIDDGGQTPLQIASAAGYVDFARLLLENHADVNLGVEDTPLILASSYGKEDTVKLLIQYGAEIDKKDYDGRTALFYAKAHKQKEIQKILIKSGARTDIIDKYGISLADLDRKEIRKKVVWDL